MINLSEKTIQLKNDLFYVYSQLVYNGDVYILVSKVNEQISSGTYLYKLILENDKYYIDDEIDKNVLEKFVVYLSI